MQVHFFIYSGSFLSIIINNFFKIVEDYFKIFNNFGISELIVICRFEKLI